MYDKETSVHEEEQQIKTCLLVVFYDGDVKLTRIILHNLQGNNI
jgi:hypothetical protein